MRAKLGGDDGLKASLADKEKSHVSGIVAVEYSYKLQMKWWVKGMVRWLESGGAMP